jgi:hypothetical protein
MSIIRKNRNEILQNAYNFKARFIEFEHAVEHHQPVTKKEIKILIEKLNKIKELM